MIAALCALPLLAAAVAAEPAADAVSGASSYSPSQRLYVAAQVGLPLPLGVQGLVSLHDDTGPRWDLDLLLEPSRDWQSLGVGAGFRPFHNALVVGARARWLQTHAPWARGYVFALDNAFALSPEVGARWNPGAADKPLVSLTVGGLFSPWGRAALPPMLTLNLGVGWKAAER